ncbi:unnamed protein product [Gongylonema pulchrum]|uniref:Omp85 domain-containing protein n=1 Tax=Gongylonema pulchrum TaxID=637853 RepID=A0A183DD11_9BILA|nr:unnamed protein product [Gongylonema pulchrum]
MDWDHGDYIMRGGPVKSYSVGATPEWSIGYPQAVFFYPEEQASVKLDISTVTISMAYRNDMERLHFRIVFDS